MKNSERTHLEIIGWWRRWSLWCQNFFFWVCPRLIRISVQEHGCRVQRDVIIVHVQRGPILTSNYSDLYRDSRVDV